MSTKTQSPTASTKPPKRYHPAMKRADLPTDVKAQSKGLDRVIQMRLAELERRLVKLESDRSVIITPDRLVPLLSMPDFDNNLPIWGFTPDDKLAGDIIFIAHTSEISAAKRKLDLQEKILANVAVIDQADACEFLGFSKSNPSAALKRRDAELLRFNQNGKVVYPLFQFDIDNRRVFPAMVTLKKLKPAGWSDYRLLNWLSRHHMDFDGIPYRYLSDEESVIAAFKREIEPQEFG